MIQRTGNNGGVCIRMGDFLVREAILPQLAATSKEGVIREMVASLVAAGQLRGTDLNEVVHAILQRETLGTTGIGRGIAIPHAKHQSVQRVLGTLAISQDGVSFASLDGQPVYLLALLVSPSEAPAAHLQALERIARCLRDDRFV